MDREFVPHDIALDMKMLGFNEKCIFYYAPDTVNVSPPTTGVCSSDRYGIVATPLYQQAFRWFREEYQLWFRPDYYDETRKDCSGSIHKLGKYSAVANLDKYNSVEEAELGCLRELIEIVKDK